MHSRSLPLTTLASTSQMDFLSNLAKNVGSKPEPESDKPDSSSGSLFTDAKLVAEAAQAQFSNDPEKNYDKAKVAGSAANILDAASDYAKLDQTKGVGKYVNQAEDYLRQYNTSPAAAGPDKQAPAGPVKESGGGEAAAPPAAEAEKPAGGSEACVPPAAEAEKGYGDLMKMAGDFLKK